MATLNVKDFPDTLHQKLRARARRNDRSLAQEVTHILAEAVAGPPRLSVLELRGLGRELWVGWDAGKDAEEERGSRD